MHANWIVQTTATTGAGNLTLASVTGYPALSSQFAAGQAISYVILDDATGVPIERGIGALNGSGELVRSKVTATMEAGSYGGVNPSAANLPAGTKRVICSASAHSVMAAAPGVWDGGAGMRGYGDVHGAGSAQNSTAITANRAYAIPFMAAVDSDLVGIGFRLGGTTGAAGTTAKAAIYSVGTDGLPGVKLAESSAVAVDSTGNKTCSFARMRPPQRFFACLLSDGAPQIQGFTGSFSLTHCMGFGGSAMLPITNIHQDGATGLTFPTTWTPTRNDYSVYRPMLVALCA